MWHLAGFLFHFCFNVQGQVRILLSDFCKLCPSHTHAESSEKKSYIQQGIKVLTYGLSAGLTTTLWKLYLAMISYWNLLTSALHLNKDDDINYLVYILSLPIIPVFSIQKTEKPVSFCPDIFLYHIITSWRALYVQYTQTHVHVDTFHPSPGSHGNTHADFTCSVSVWELWGCRRGW